MVTTGLGGFLRLQCTSRVLSTNELLLSWSQEAFPSGLAAALPNVTMLNQMLAGRLLSRCPSVLLTCCEIMIELLLLIIHVTGCLI